jgi:non-canonical (house-cleaning) NTP pyrophosphatase
MKIKEIVLGNSGEMEFTATKDGARLAGYPDIQVTKMAVEIGLNKQLLSLNQTYLGAQLRARAVHKEHPESLAMGIESGIILTRDHCSDFVTIVLILPNQKERFTFSSGFEIPMEFFHKTFHKGFHDSTVKETTLLQFDKKYQDHYSALSKGKVTVIEIMTETVYYALLRL